LRFWRIKDLSPEKAFSLAEAQRAQRMRDTRIRIQFPDSCFWPCLLCGLERSGREKSFGLLPLRPRLCAFLKNMENKGEDDHDGRRIKENPGNRGEIVRKRGKLNPALFPVEGIRPDLANDFSKFITGNLYSRTVLTLPERQMGLARSWSLYGPSGNSRFTSMGPERGCDPRKLTK